MLDEFNNQIKKIVKQISDFQNFLTGKSVLYFGLAAYWGIILFGTLFNL